MKIKLTRNNTLGGQIYARGETVSVPREEAIAAIRMGKATLVESEPEKEVEISVKRVSVKMLRSKFVEGQLAEEGGIVKVSEKDAAYLIAKGTAEAVKEVSEQKSEPKKTEPKTGK